MFCRLRSVGCVTFGRRAIHQIQLRSNLYISQALHNRLVLLRHMLQRLFLDESVNDSKQPRKEQEEEEEEGQEEEDKKRRKRCMGGSEEEEEE